MTENSSEWKTAEPAAVGRTAEAHQLTDRLLTDYVLAAVK
jgi:hypothetical protein